MVKEEKTTTTVRITYDLKDRLDALWVTKKDSYEIILRRLVCLHELVKDNPTLIDEARRIEEAENVASKKAIRKRA